MAVTTQQKKIVQIPVSNQKNNLGNLSLDIQNIQLYCLLLSRVWLYSIHMNKNKHVYKNNKTVLITGKLKSTSVNLASEMTTN